MGNFNLLRLPLLSKMVLSLLICGVALNINAEKKTGPDNERQNYKIYVDKQGVMRRSDTKQEVSYYGTNYTLPFAHAYRAMGQLGIDRKEAIDRDVYHMSRLGFNGFRLHLWDAELADSAGNLLDNEHLDLLDYLISRLENEGIDIILTAQTNFGNGYPEKNIDTGAFTYDYDKCEIHSNPKAQEIQANYLTQLAKHVNPYTGRSYSGDNAIIAMEVNNEPCHTDTPKDVTRYINKMVKALKKAGFDKPILYNVSHNPDVTEAYYDADIQGTTYQWYPTGLVAGHQRKGNFLPYVQEYQIPWKDTMKNYDKMARVVYEFDPGDVLYSYLYPAIARAFRKEGFQWITQFAYDPIDMAQYNTEYQTHFLNLAYTPSKAISMLIAGEAARKLPRGIEMGSSPSDTVFGDFSVSYVEDLSVYNTADKFYYSNSNTKTPKSMADLKNIAGVGSSKLVEYGGTGAYFLEEVQPGLWRLEIMPDVVLTSDPFAKPSLDKEIAKVFYAERGMKIDLPQLGPSFFYQAIDEYNDRKGEAKQGFFTAYPGVYLLSADKNLISQTIDNPDFRNSGLSKYVAPVSSGQNSIVIHSPKKYVGKESDLVIEAEVIGEMIPDSVTVYPSHVSFWNEHNLLYPMERISDTGYRVVIPADQAGRGAVFNYNIVVSENGSQFTWPQNVEGTPIEWDFTEYEYYTTKKIREKDALVVLAAEEKDPNIDVAMIPEAWNFRFEPRLAYPVGINVYQLSSLPEKDGKIVVRRYIGDELKGAPDIKEKDTLVISLLPEVPLEGVSVGLTTKDGVTHSQTLSPEFLTEANVKLHSDRAQSRQYRIPLSSLYQTATNILPAVYPSFLPREVEMPPQAFDAGEYDFVELVFPAKTGERIDVGIEGIWLE